MIKKLKRQLYHKFMLLGKLPSFPKRFGFGLGLRIFSKLFFGTGEVLIRLPGMREPIVVRAYESDLIVFWEVFVKECYKAKIPVAASVIVDAGANTGLSTAYFAEQFPAATIVAIEPEDRNVALLKLNCSAYPNVKVVESAIWGEKTHLRIANPQSSGWGFIVEETNEDDPNSFAATTISEIASDFGLETIDLLKLDIEGSERNVFSSENIGWLNRVNSLIVELHDYEHPGCRQPVVQACNTAQLELESEIDHVCHFTRIARKPR